MLQRRDQRVVGQRGFNATNGHLHVCEALRDGIHYGRGAQVNRQMAAATTGQNFDNMKGTKAMEAMKTVVEAASGDYGFASVGGRHGHDPRNVRPFNTFQHGLPQWFNRARRRLEWVSPGSAFG